jgi:hypothetical protein
MKEQILARVLIWAFSNDIEIAVGKYKTEGLASQIEITMKKNGKTEYIRLINWDEMDAGWLKKAVETCAFNLCLTRLIL